MKILFMGTPEFARDQLTALWENKDAHGWDIVGVLRRVVVIECEPGEVLELINPVIVERSGEQYEIEGCLSVPGRQGYTHRPMHVKVEALNRAGEKVTLEGEGLLARAFCHEIDHLDGILYIDHADMAVEE